MRALRLTASLCHSVSAEHALLEALATRPERRRQQFLRELAGLGLASVPPNCLDQTHSGLGEQVVRVVLHLNPAIPADAAVLASFDLVDQLLDL